MKILHVITKLHEMYGAQRYAAECIKDHVANGYECKIITGTFSDACIEVEEAGAEIIKIEALRNSYNILNDIRAVSGIIGIINTYQPDLVISHSTKAGVLARIACYARGIPNIFTVHGWAFEKGAPWYQKMVGIVIERLLRPVSDVYMCVSNYTAEYGKRKLKIPDHKLYVCPGMHTRISAMPDFSIKKNVLMVAALRPQKDHITALKAIRQVVYGNKMCDIQFVFAGDGPQRKALEAFIAQHKLEPYVILTGQTKDIDQYYNACDIVILPTYYEGLPLSLIEALQRGKPIIATNVGGISEIVYDNNNGNLIDVEDDISLANYIVKYYNQKDAIYQMSLASLNIYDTYYNHKKLSIQLNFIIHEVLRQKRKPVINQ